MCLLNAVLHYPKTLLKKGGGQQFFRLSNSRSRRRLVGSLQISFNPHTLARQGFVIKNVLVLATGIGRLMGRFCLKLRFLEVSLILKHILLQNYSFDILHHFAKDLFSLLIISIVSIANIGD